MSAIRPPSPPVSSTLRPRVVVLPGMDGSASLLIDTFISALKSAPTASDPSRVILVDYPYDAHLPPPALCAHITRTYLADVDDPRGFIVVSQSFSGHVALLLGQASNCRGVVLVNCFCSCPLPAARPVMRALPAAVFALQPPAGLVARLFFGPRGTAAMMGQVQESVSRVTPDVMKARLGEIADLENWAMWRDVKTVVAGKVLYLRGEEDVLVGKTRHIQLLQQARPDLEFATVQSGPHLVLQTDGARCARIVDEWLDKVLEGGG